MDEYKIKLDAFEGPLDLLLYLIKKNEIDIYDIPIAEITRQYLEYLELMRVLDLEIAGDFLVMSATLIYIKSKMLLPQDELEEEVLDEDPREELAKKLAEYKKFKEAAQILREKEKGTSKIYYRRRIPPDIELEFEDDFKGFEASIFDLISAFDKVLKNIPKKEFLEIIEEEYTVDEKIDFITVLLEEKGILYFDQIWDRIRNKLEAIVTFLALLELIKIRCIIVRQIGLFGEIKIMKPLPVLCS
jgi:segregation and condensation protein A